MAAVELLDTQETEALVEVLLIFQQVLEVAEVVVVVVEPLGILALQTRQELVVAVLD
jgi:hypothetical protein